MNPTEQRRHTTNLQMLEKTTEQALSEMDLALRDFVREQVGGERTHRLKLADEQRAYVDSADRNIKGRLEILESRARSAQRLTLLGRLIWLFTGRLPL